MLKAEDYRVDLKEIDGLKVNITSYRIGSTYYCHIDNVDPGAVIARSEGESHEEVIQATMARAMERLKPKVR
ncbi:MAG: hypothetical protein HY033_04930 [Ignavibacteriae bacterium]|nr:hypothetical protein [Ignavibacteria bacterium]MBI3364234.1 hypothetical protein [Ignavibacteriota bacterium]